MSVYGSSDPPYGAVVVDARRFVEAVDREVHRSVGDAMEFSADIEEPVPGVVTVVRIRFRGPAGIVDGPWVLRHLAGVVGSEDVSVLARHVVTRMLSPLPVITLDCDWGHEWPLWSSDFENPVPSASDLGASDGVASRLRSFYDFWDEHYLFELGWDDESNRSAALERAESLVTELTTELAGTMTVENGFRASFG